MHTERTTGHSYPVLRDQPDDLGEAKRHEREIVTTKSERWKTHTKADQAAQNGSDSESEPRQDVKVKCEAGRGVGTDRKKSGMAERNLSSVAAQQIPARRQQRPDR